MSTWLPTPGGPDWRPEVKEIARSFMEMEPGDEAENATRQKLGDLADEWDRIRMNRPTGDLDGTG